MDVFDTLTIGVGEWPPFLSKDLKFGGPVANYILKILKSQGIDVEYKWLPWKRSYKLAILDSTAPWRKNEARMKSFYFSKPLCGRRQSTTALAVGE